jgi:hypothetical protein
MNRDARVVGQELRQRRALIANHADVHAGRGEGMGVVLHPGTPAEIPGNNDGCAHSKETL